MQVILLEPLQGVGQMGDTVSVKAGFARNFLLPRNKALPASKQNVALFEKRKAELEKQMEARKTEAEATAAKLDGVSVKLSRQASETGQLYGSVKARDIESALEEQGIEVQRSQIWIGSAIKVLGEHNVQISLHPEVLVELPVNVVRQSV